MNKAGNLPPCHLTILPPFPPHYPRTFPTLPTRHYLFAPVPPPFPTYHVTTLAPSQLPELLTTPSPHLSQLTSSLALLLSHLANSSPPPPSHLPPPFPSSLPPTTPFPTLYVTALQPLQFCCLTALPQPFSPSLLTTLPPFLAQHLPSNYKITTSISFSTHHPTQP